MKLVIGDRQTGKTTRMIEWLREGDNSLAATEVRVLVCASGQTAMAAYRSTFDADGNSDLESWQFVSVDDITEPGALRGVTVGARQKIVLGIDQVDIVIRHFIKYFPILIATMDDEGVERLPESLAAKWLTRPQGQDDEGVERL